MDTAELMVFLIGFVIALVLVVYLVQFFSTNNHALPRSSRQASPPST
jgi:hypothetical protein